MKRFIQAIITAAVILAAWGLHAADLTVFAAASLTDSLKEIAGNYEKQAGGKIVFNFGASSTLARQIQEGAPADIFFSADEAKMDALEKRGLIASSTRKSRLSNSLVIVTAADSLLQINSATNLTDTSIKRIALADPQTVPAGIYSRIYLEKIHLWTVIAPKVVPTDNVRAALAAVESGNVEAGMVYRTDAAISRKVKVACEIPAKDCPDISYPLAVVKESTQPDAAQAFLKYLEGDEASHIFERYGFIVRR